MYRRHKFLFAAVIAVLFFSCSNQFYYKKGLYHAQNPTSASIYSALTQVTPSNSKLIRDTIDGIPYVLAVSWKQDTIYFTKNVVFKNGKRLYSYNTGSRPIFVTMAPYLKEKDLKGLGDSQLTMRLNQMLGLPPTARYSYFMEIWVKESDFFRPCFDPSTGTSVCEFVPSDNDQKNAGHMNWLYKYIYDSYSDTDMMKRYPFSHLGYTYDWNHKNKSHVGLSEFVIGNGKDIYIRKIYTTRSYFE